MRLAVLQGTFSQVIIRAQLSSLERTIHRERDPLNSALVMLFRAYQYAVDTKANRWQFAIEMEEFRNAGITVSELRWLVAKGLALQAKEIFDTNCETRKFVALKTTAMSSGTCFVLTDYGVSFLEKAIHAFHQSHPGNSGQTGLPPEFLNGNNAGLDQVSVVSEVPVWNPLRRELRFKGMIVKNLSLSACNQEAIVVAFEEEHWVERIDDPLPPIAGQDPRRRLNETIKQLNRKHRNSLIRFRSDGSGTGVQWEVV